MQREVAGEGAVAAQPEFKRLSGQRVAAGEGGVADFLRLLRSTAQKGINPRQAGAGNDVFGRHPAILRQQPAPQFALLRRLRREAEVAAFAGDDAVAAALPDQSGDAESGTGAEDEARRLGELRNSAQRASRPSAIQSGDGQDHEPVRIPGADDFKPPEAFRKDLLEAMKQAAPDAYREQVKRYYEELVK